MPSKLAMLRPARPWGLVQSRPDAWRIVQSAHFILDFWSRSQFGSHRKVNVMAVSRWTLGLVVAIGLSGCNGDQGEYRDFQSTDNVQNTSHEHAHVHGPNGGHVLELGDLGNEELHAEIAMDSASRKISVYLLDEAVKSAKPVENGVMSLALAVDGKETVLEMTAAPLEGETDGKSSRFELAGDKVPAAMSDLEALAGKLTLKVGDKDLTTSLKEEHDHDHGHEGHAH